MDAAIFFEPDGYLLDGPRLMGRQSAGNGFLRAAVAGRAGDMVIGYTASPESAEIFKQTVASLDPTASARWIPGPQLNELAQVGVLYRPDQVLGIPARLRLRVGPGAFSICGVTHTLATSNTLEALGDLIAAPLMPWDALVCTSTVAVGVVEAALAEQADYLRWRFGDIALPARPQLPVIPLGVHSHDFAFGPGDRQTARAALQISDDEVVALFAGRMSFNGKAHPYPMLKALQTVAETTGKPIALVQAGQFASPHLEAAYRDAARLFCPDVRVLFVGGQDAAAYRQTWAAADLFISLSDSIQETFGITPVEAMAAGLPVLVTDWNGYKDTVRDGVDGFRIPTFAPEPGGGETLARTQEAGVIAYDYFLAYASGMVALDMAVLVERLTALVTDPDLRRRMGEAGRQRARTTFEWATIYRQYQALWDALCGLRAALAPTQDYAARLAAAPRASVGHMDPLATFAQYPSHRISGSTVVSLAPGASGEAFATLLQAALMTFYPPPRDLVDRVFAALAAGPMPLEDLGKALGRPTPKTIETVARLTKFDLLTLTFPH